MIPKPQVDYRKLRLSNINTPEFAHVKLIAGWVVYILCFILTEQLIPAEVCHPIWCPLDDVIPFCEWFVIPYITWYPFIAFTLIYYLFYNVDKFKRLQCYIMILQAVAIISFVVYPSRQDLRPEVLPRDNLLTQIIAGLYAADTNTGVCPSLHVSISLAIAEAWLRDKAAPAWWRWAMAALGLLISISVVFVKQHSVLDVLAAIPGCLLAEYIIYWRPRRKKKA